MPGILPMKVIKVGNSSQSRIAQACDRCRSKKIRCDGIRPCCSQCANVGFECRTSDKLSRRAFPRGYTESLEERVRVLEAETRELKDLLDEKDEKIDMLSRIHGSRGRSSEPSQSSTAADSNKAPGSPTKEDTFRVQASPLLLGVENSDSYFMGASSGRSFIGEYSLRISSRIFELLNVNRNIQAQDSRKRQVMLRLQPGGFPSHSGLLPSHSQASFPDHEDTTAVIFRPVCQCLLPGVGTAVSSCAQAYFPPRL